MGTRTTTMARSPLCSFEEITLGQCQKEPLGLKPSQRFLPGSEGVAVMGWGQLCVRSLMSKKRSRWSTPKWEVRAPIQEGRMSVLGHRAELKATGPRAEGRQHHWLTRGRNQTVFQGRAWKQEPLTRAWVWFCRPE